MKIFQNTRSKCDNMNKNVIVDVGDYSLCTSLHILSAPTHHNGILRAAKYDNFCHKAYVRQAGRRVCRRKIAASCRQSSSWATQRATHHIRYLVQAGERVKKRQIFMLHEVSGQRYLRVKMFLLIHCHVDAAVRPLTNLGTAFLIIMYTCEFAHNTRTQFPVRSQA